MSIYRSSGKWKAELWIDGTRIIAKAGFVTKEKAREWKSKAILDYRADADRFSNPKSYTFDDLIEKYETIHLPTISPETQLRYQCDIKRIKKYFQHRTLESITPMQVETFRAKIMPDLMPKSVNNCTMLLFSIFRKAEEWGMADKNPVKIKRLKIYDQKYSWWEKKEHITRFLEAAKHSRYYLAFRLALETGMRLGEIVGLSKQDVNFERNEIHVYRQWLNRRECYGPTKGRKERFIYFNPQSTLRNSLIQAIEQSPHPEAIIVTAEGERVRPRRLAARHFDRVLKKAEVPPIRFHDLRHTFASWYMIEIGDIWSLKGILGHVDVQTTQRYAHLSKQHQRPPALSWVTEN